VQREAVEVIAQQCEQDCESSDLIV
jgi:hypothetical protein